MTPEIALPFLMITGMSLLVNSLSDLKTRKIDSRLNYMAMGATIMMIIFLNITFIQLIGIAIIGTISQLFFKKFMASGDLEAFSWIYLFLGAYSFFNLAVFMMSYVLLNALAYVAVRLSIFKETFTIPYYPIILGAYILSMLV